MPTKIKCPFHQDKTASLAIYEETNSYFCFGCGATGSSGQLYTQSRPTQVNTHSDRREDLEQAFQYIFGLPKRPFRGLEFHCDATGYYIVWPDLTYYKKRMFDDKEVKYIGAKGHVKPWFWVSKGYSTDVSQVVVLEGEINAISGRRVLSLDFVSPGGSGDFTSKYTREQGLTQLLSYDKILLVADKDAAGAKAVIGLNNLLMEAGKSPKYLLMAKDANQILVEDGKEALRRIFEEALS